MFSIASLDRERCVPDPASFFPHSPELGFSICMSSLVCLAFLGVWRTRHSQTQNTLHGESAKWVFLLKAAGDAWLSAELETCLPYLALQLLQMPEMFLLSCV